MKKIVCPECQGKRFSPQDSCVGMMCGGCNGSGYIWVEPTPKEFLYRFEIEKPSPGLPGDWYTAKAWSDYPIGRAA